MFREDDDDWYVIYVAQIPHVLVVYGAVWKLDFFGIKIKCQKILAMHNFYNCRFTHR